MGARIDFEFKGLGQEKGFSLIEVMVSVLILSIMGMGITRSCYTALRCQKLVQIGIIAQNIAVSRIESMAALPFATLGSTYNETDTTVTNSGTTVEFLRDTTITTNSDGSKSIVVTVTSDNDSLPTTVTLTSRFSPWELT